MSRIVKIGAASVISFVTATSVFALTTAEAMDEFDLLAISETPLTESELGEARGGFQFGGFDFKFGVEISPITVENPASSGMFGDGGLFGDGSVFGDDGGPIGQGGVFGGSSVFGENKVVPDNAQSAAAVDTSPFKATAQAAKFENTAVDVVQQPVASAAPELITQQTIPILADTSSATSSITPAMQGPAQIISDAVADAIPEIAVAQAVGGIVDAAIAPDTTPAAIIEAVVAPEMQSSTPSSPRPQTSAAPPEENAVQQPSTASAPVKSTITQRISQTMTRNGRTTVIDNNINGAHFTQTIELYVRVGNFDSRISRAIADAAVATIISTNYLLGQIN